MNDDRVWLTREGRDRLMAELERRKTVDRPRISRAIAAARAHGDLSENAEYDAAKEQQGLLEARIRELDDKLARSAVVDEYDVDTDAAVLGSVVKLRDVNRERQLTYTLVGEIEADFAAGRISVTSLVGKALIGKQAGDTIEVEVPAGTLRFEVIEVSR